MNGYRLSQASGWRGPGSIAMPRARSSRASPPRAPTAARTSKASGLIFSGVATSFGTIHSDDRMIFEPGCFAKSLAKGRPISLQIYHDDSLIIARIEDGLEILEDSQGLTFRCPVPDTDLGLVAAALVKTGKLTEVSVGCGIRREERATIGGRAVRAVKEASLDEISLVPRGAVFGTEIALVDLHNEADVRLERMAAKLRSIGIKTNRLTAW